MKRNSTLKSYTPLKRGNGFKKVVGNSLISGKSWKVNPSFKGSYGKSLKKSSFKRTPTDLQKQVTEADSKFSRFIINRDKKCMRCGTNSMLTCSHFHGRANYATRYEPLNCVAFCTECHNIWESKKSTEYMDFMLEWLGVKQFMVLDHLSKMKMSKQDSLILANNLLKKVEENSDIQY
jgi:hypothetical protein